MMNFSIYATFTSLFLAMALGIHNDNLVRVQYRGHPNVLKRSQQYFSHLNDRTFNSRNTFRPISKPEVMKNTHNLITKIMSPTDLHRESLKFNKKFHPIQSPRLKVAMSPSSKAHQISNKNLPSKGFIPIDVTTLKHRSNYYSNRRANNRLGNLAGLQALRTERIIENPATDAKRPGAKMIGYFPNPKRSDGEESFIPSMIHRSVQGNNRSSKAKENQNIRIRLFRGRSFTDRDNSVPISMVKPANYDSFTTEDSQLTIRDEYNEQKLPNQLKNYKIQHLLLPDFRVHSQPAHEDKRMQTREDNRYSESTQTVPSNLYDISFQDKPYYNQEKVNQNLVRNQRKRTQEYHPDPAEDTHWNLGYYDSPSLVETYHPHGLDRDHALEPPNDKEQHSLADPAQTQIGSIEDPGYTYHPHGLDRNHALEPPNDQEQHSLADHAQDQIGSIEDLGYTYHPHGLDIDHAIAPPNVHHQHNIPDPVQSHISNLEDPGYTYHSHGLDRDHTIAPPNEHDQHNMPDPSQTHIGNFGAPGYTYHPHGLDIDHAMPPPNEHDLHNIPDLDKTQLGNMEDHGNHGTDAYKPADHDYPAMSNMHEPLQGSISETDAESSSPKAGASAEIVDDINSNEEEDFKADHTGFLDMGAYTDEKGSFGWYADFPVGRIHDKVTYSFS